MPPPKWHELGLPGYQPPTHFGIEMARHGKRAWHGTKAKPKRVAEVGKSLGTKQKWHS